MNLLWLERTLSTHKSHLIFILATLADRTLEKWTGRLFDVLYVCPVSLFLGPILLTGCTHHFHLFLVVQPNTTNLLSGVHHHIFYCTRVEHVRVCRSPTAACIEACVRLVSARKSAAVCMGMMKALVFLIKKYRRILNLQSYGPGVLATDSK